MADRVGDGGDSGIAGSFAESGDEQGSGWNETSPREALGSEDNQDQACWCESMGGVDAEAHYMTTRTDDGGRSHVVKVVMKGDTAKNPASPGR